MNSFLYLTIVRSGTTNWLIYINDLLFELINGVAGRSKILDELIALPVFMPFVGVAVLGSCFLIVWFRDNEDGTVAAHRKVLLIALLASCLALVATGAISKSVFQARPYLLSQETLHLEGNRLVKSQKLDFRVPLDDESQDNFKAMTKGDTGQTDMDSFPSREAAFFIPLVIGILLASRNIGLAALCWTVFVTLGTRVVTGFNSPLDIAAGSAVGLGIVLLLQILINKFAVRPIESVVKWTFKYQALATAMIFIFLLDSLTLFSNLQHILAAVAEIGKQMVRG